MSVPASAILAIIAFVFLAGSAELNAQTASSLRDGTCEMTGEDAVDLMNFNRYRSVVGLFADPCRRRGGQPAMYYPLVIAERRGVQIRMWTDHFKSQVLLRGPDGTLLAQASGDTATIRRTLAPGTYFIGASSVQPNASGSAQFLVEASGEPVARLAPLRFGGECTNWNPTPLRATGSVDLEIAFSRRSCRNQSGDYARVTQYLVPIAGAATITARARGYDASVALYSGDGKLLDERRATNPVTQITRAIEAGTYYIVVSGPRLPVTEPYSYRLSVEFARASASGVVDCRPSLSYDCGYDLDLRRVASWKSGTTGQCRLSSTSSGYLIGRMDLRGGMSCRGGRLSYRGNPAILETTFRILRGDTTGTVGAGFRFGLEEDGSYYSARVHADGRVTLLHVSFPGPGRSSTVNHFNGQVAAVRRGFGQLNQLTVELHGEEARLLVNGVAVTSRRLATVPAANLQLEAVGSAVEFHRARFHPLPR